MPRKTQESQIDPEQKPEQRTPETETRKDEEEHIDGAEEGHEPTRERGGRYGDGWW